MRECFHMAVTGEEKTVVAPVFVHIENCDTHWWKLHRVSLKNELVLRLTEEIHAIEDQWRSGGRAINVSDSTAEEQQPQLSTTAEKQQLQPQIQKALLQPKRVAAKDQMSSYSRAPPPTRLHSNNSIIAYAVSKRSKYKMLPLRSSTRAIDADSSDSDEDTASADTRQGSKLSGAKRKASEKRSSSSTRSKAPMFAKDYDMSEFAIQCWLYPPGSDEKHPGKLLPIFS
jgi:hypothetical protein